MQTCPKCSKQHEGRFPKCFECWKAEKDAQNASVDGKEDRMIRMSALKNSVELMSVLEKCNAIPQEIKNDGKLLMEYVHALAEQHVKYIKGGNTE